MERFSAFIRILLLSAFVASFAVMRTVGGEPSRLSIEERMTIASEWISQYVERSLPDSWKEQASVISAAILHESERNKLNPLVLVALIETESSFRPDAQGQAGDSGLMQLRPSTAEWIAEKASLPWKGPASLKDPITNIQLGAAYLGMLRERFGADDDLYLAAYNMGPKNLFGLLGNGKQPSIYSSRIYKRLRALNEALAEAERRRLSEKTLLLASRS